MRVSRSGLSFFFSMFSLPFEMKALKDMMDDRTQHDTSQHQEDDTCKQSVRTSHQLAGCRV